MTGRDALIADFIARHGWGAAQRVPLAGDASFRRYWRLTDGTRSAILMDAPPERLDPRPFLAIDARLRAFSYSAPLIYASDERAGLVLLEDFGDASFAARIAAGDDPAELYELAIDWLIDLHRHRDASEGLPDYDDARLLEEVGRFLLWYVPAVLDAPLEASAEIEFDSLWRALIPVARRMPRTFVYRDFHIENLMLLPRPGLAACGLLDFQDAVAGPSTYDLASLLEDARRDLPPDLAANMKARYLDAFPALDRDDFAASWAVMAAHRHVKCLGLFVRLARRDGKPAYLAHIPRLWRLLGQSLPHPALAPLAGWLDRHLPPERRAVPAP
jgi:aminoglycoside/choline kinase family phosphotransferase